MVAAVRHGGMEPSDGRAIGQGVRWLDEAASASKCWPCGCLGHELVRAEQALQTGRPFVQDAAPGVECPEEPLSPLPKPT
jgi:hypothetical protein